MNSPRTRLVDGEPVPGGHMLLTFKTLQGDLNLQSDFSQPGFALFSDPLGLQRRLFEKLSKHGVRLTDIRWDQGSGTLGDFNLLCYLFGFAVTLRIRLERVEFQCPDASRIDTKRLTEVTTDVLTLLEGPGSGARFKTHSVTVSYHGLLENASAKDFIAKFVFRGAENLGPYVGSGTVFYYGAEGSRLSSAVTFDLSVQVKDGLFLRVQSVWDAQKVPVQELPNAVNDYLGAALANFGLQWAER